MWVQGGAGNRTLEKNAHREASCFVLRIRYSSVNQVGRACGVHLVEARCMRDFDGDYRGKRDHLEDLGIDGSTVK